MSRLQGLIVAAALVAVILAFLFRRTAAKPLVIRVNDAWANNPQFRTPPRLVETSIANPEMLLSQSSGWSFPTGRRR